jgi:hypothetical protein
VSDALQPSTLRCTRRDPHREEGVRVPPSDAGHRPQGVDRVTRSPRRRRSTERPPSRVGAEIGTRHVATAGWGERAVRRHASDRGWAGHPAASAEGIRTPI